ncbi:hypothetical protein [Pseudoteredinibacter isoporae]|uniref:hypothetical protein n=1 Tax=Pseudoteredinibacter isoporae TaxID=570281 RepID=UPI00333E9C73
MSVIAGTPLWVYPLFLVLLVCAVWQSRDRTASVIQLSILPLIFPVISTLRLIELGYILSIAYLSILLLASVLLVYVRIQNKVQTSASSGKVRLAKDWLRGTGILLIFFCQYYLAARHAMKNGELMLWEFATYASLSALATSPMLSTAIAAWQVRRSLYR